jgi:hypothetical protein
MSVDARIYSYARTQVHPSVRMRFFALAQPDWRKDCARAIFEVGPDENPFSAYAVIEVPWQAVSNE